MPPTSISFFGESNSVLENILENPEGPDLLRMTTLVEHLFQVPVVYMALLDHSSNVVTRIGSGREYWESLNTYPLSAVVGKPAVVRDAGFGLPPGTEFGALRFAASAPLLTSGQTTLGMLVIADRQPRPDFSEVDEGALSELALMLAGKMELRMIASHALESELAMRESERRFRAIANTAPVLIVYGGADGACSFVNKTWLDFTGRTMEEELGDGWSDPLHSDCRDMVIELYWRAFQVREAFTVEFLMRRHDGVYRWMLAQAVPRFLDDSTFAGFVATLVDITDYHNAILEVKKQALCTSAVANAARLFYLVLDPKGKIEYASPIRQRAWGGDPQEMLGTVIWETTAARQGAGAIRGAVQQAASSRTIVQLETAGASADGEAMDLGWTITPIVSGGELLALVTTVAESRRGLSEGSVRSDCGELSSVTI